MTIDLRSDFVSRPTQEMVEAMSEAAKSRCFFGLREDPIQKRLEELAANIIGKEDALFLPTCTMCNQVAINIFCSPGDKFIAESESHCVVSEAGAPSALSGVMAKTIPGKMGFIDPQELEENIELSDELRSRISLIVIENTHNRAGGTVLSSDQIYKICSVSKRHDIPVHLDGARIFNAAVYLELPVRNLTNHVESVSISLNKGLSAPMGAILAGSKSFIKEAVRVRQRFGGGWRPTNILAAAGILALEHMIDRLVEDHDNARKLALGLVGAKGLSIDLKRVQTNLIIVEIDHPVLSIERIITRLKDHDILVMRFGSNLIRMAVHREIQEPEVTKVLNIFHEIVESY